MSAREIDEYFAAQTEPQRSTLEVTRAIILDLYPDATQIISYGMPAFKVDDVVVAGLAATKKGISFYPHSGQVISAAGDVVAGFSATQGALHAPADRALPVEVIATLIRLKLELARKPRA